MSALTHLYLAGAVMTLLLSVLAVAAMPDRPEMDRAKRISMFFTVIVASILWPLTWPAAIAHAKAQRLKEQAGKGGDS